MPRYIKHLAEIDHIEQLNTGEDHPGSGGREGSSLRDFYAVFQTPPEWE